MSPYRVRAVLGVLPTDTAGPECHEHRALLLALNDEIELLRNFIRREFKASRAGAEEAVLLRRATDLHVERTRDLTEALRKHQEEHRC